MHKCGTDELRRRIIEMDPTYLEREAAYAEEIRQLIAANTQMRDGHPLITLPVVFHVLHLGGRENISDEQILSELEVLNRDFRNLNPDLATAVPYYQDISEDAMIEFRLPTIDPDGFCTTGIERIYTVETLRGGSESKLRPWPRSKYINIWVTHVIDRAGNVLGYATLPGSAEGPLQFTDGIMVRHEAIGTMGTAIPAWAGTLTHEMGHFLNLLHLWGQTNDPVVGDCGDDGVEDTPLTKGHNNCSNRFSYVCTSTNFYNSMNFNAVTPSSGSTDPSIMPNPRVIYLQDTLGMGVDFNPMVAVGVSSNSVAAGEFAFTNWGTGAEEGDTYADLDGTLDNTKFYEFTFFVHPQVAMRPTQLKFSVRRSADGPRTFSVQRGASGNLPIAGGAGSGIQNQSGNVGFFMNDDEGGWVHNVSVNLNNPQASQEPVTIRFYAWNAESEDGVFAIDNVQLEGDFGEIENVENYMEYAFCSKMFTQGQVDRMRAALTSPAGERSSLGLETTLQATGIADGFQMVCPPVADFYANTGAPSFADPAIPYPGMTCTGNQVQFRDNSRGGVPTSWSWTFQDGVPATSDQRNPIVTFDVPGWKQVTLTVGNEHGTNSITKDFAIHIGNSEEAMPGLFHQSFEQDWGIWPFISWNYERNHTFFDRYVGAGHTGNACVRLNSGDRDFFDYVDFNNSTDIDELITPNLNLVGLSDATLSFWYSYSTQTNTLEDVTEELHIQRSLDCGRTWSWIGTQNNSTIGKADLITNGNSQVPTQWKFKSYNLTNNLLGPNVRFRFRFISSAFSNHLFIDDINIGGPVGMADATGNTPMTIFPNPTNDHFYVQMEGMEQHATEVTLMDGRGAVVYSAVLSAKGENGLLISSRELGLADGLYVIRVSNELGTSTQKLMVGN